MQSTIHILDNTRKVRYNNLAIQYSTQLQSIPEKQKERKDFCVYMLNIMTATTIITVTLIIQICPTKTTNTSMVITKTILKTPPINNTMNISTATSLKITTILKLTPTQTITITITTTMMTTNDKHNVTIEEPKWSIVVCQRACFLACLLACFVNCFFQFYEGFPCLIVRMFLPIYVWFDASLMVCLSLLS